MAARPQDIEASETPAVKDLRTLFEQKARESPPVLGGPSHSGNSSAALLNPRQSVGRISSPTPFYDPAEPLIPVKHDQSSLRKRPPPPPPSRAQKPQLGSPSPSISPLLHPAPDQSNASENHSPSSSVKQRLATRPPPPIPELRLDQNHSVDLNSEGSVKVGEPLVDLTSVVSQPPPPPSRPAQAQPTQDSPYSDPFESDPAETLPSVVPSRRNPRPPLPRRPVRLSYPPGPDDHQSETDSDGGTVSPPFCVSPRCLAPKAKAYPVCVSS
ncbi:hypothetical protein EDB92DRAFT_968526 [Lactarius akahatsu]|uniref:Uncharacterized protein n=1 Tax=Lactarius akahatsu TaxID=416441 RepID=A0AAD4LRF5_9AGAM|nr:hypothetical protein EDB92DRAFT_968526 [Lactarius akahatsu]